MNVFRMAFDREEEAILSCETDPERVAYLKERRKLGSGQCRLYEVTCYTDDPFFVVVGHDRLTRAMRLWHRIIDAVGLKMAFPRKRQ